MSPNPGDKIDKYFEAYEVGDSFTVENARTITEADVVNFAGISGDFNPSHTSTEYAKDHGYDRRVAHGNLIFVITEGILAQHNHRALASYGHDNLRFVNPVFIGDTLTCHSEVIECSDYDDEYGKVVHEYTTENQDGEVVLVNQHILLVEKEPTESGSD